MIEDSPQSEGPSQAIKIVDDALRLAAKESAAICFPLIASNRAPQWVWKLAKQLKTVEGLSALTKGRRIVDPAFDGIVVILEPNYIFNRHLVDLRALRNRVGRVAG